MDNIRRMASNTVEVPVELPWYMSASLERTVPKGMRFLTCESLGRATGEHVLSSVFEYSVPEIRIPSLSNAFA